MPTAPVQSSAPSNTTSVLRQSPERSVRSELPSFSPDEITMNAFWRKTSRGRTNPSHQADHTPQSAHLYPRRERRLRYRYRRQLGVHADGGGVIAPDRKGRKHARPNLLRRAAKARDDERPFGAGYQELRAVRRPARPSAVQGMPSNISVGSPPEMSWTSRLSSFQYATNRPLRSILEGSPRP